MTAEEMITVMKGVIDRYHRFHDAEIAIEPWHDVLMKERLVEELKWKRYGMIKAKGLAYEACMDSALQNRSKASDWHQACGYCATSLAEAIDDEVGLMELSE